MSDKPKELKELAEKGSKAKKEMYEKLLNEIFGTQIKWSKLSLEELTQLATVLANPEPLIRRLGGVPKEEAALSPFVEMIKRIVYEYEGPFVKLFRKYVLGRGEKKIEEGKEN